MLFAHFPMTENDEIVVLSFTKFGTEKGTFFALENAAFDEIRIPDVFEQSIACQHHKSKQVSSDAEKSSKGNDEGKSSSTAEIRADEFYTDKRVK